MRKTLRAVDRGESTKNAFEHYFGLDQKGNVDVEKFVPLSETFQRTIDKKGIKKKAVLFEEGKSPKNQIDQETDLL